jgi:hypothetical protein
MNTPSVRVEDPKSRWAALFRGGQEPSWGDSARPATYSRRDPHFAPMTNGQKVHGSCACSRRRGGQRRTNAWREVTSPGTGPTRPTSEEPHLLGHNSRNRHVADLQLLGDKNIHPPSILKMSRSSADIPSRLSPVTQQEARTSRNTNPSTVTSGSVKSALRTVPFAVCV